MDEEYVTLENTVERRGFVESLQLLLIFALLLTLSVAGGVWLALEWAGLAVD